MEMPLPCSHALIVTAIAVLIGWTPYAWASCPGLSGEDLQRCNCRESETLLDPTERLCSVADDCIVATSGCGDWVAVARKFEGRVASSKPKSFEPVGPKPSVHCFEQQCMLEAEYEWRRRDNQ